MRSTALVANYLDGNDEIVVMWVWGLSLGSTGEYESLGKKYFTHSGRNLKLGYNCL
jgi:hypothetical protein